MVLSMLSIPPMDTGHMAVLPMALSTSAVPRRHMTRHMVVIEVVPPMELRGVLCNQKIAHTMHTTRTMRLRCLSFHAFYNFVDLVVRHVNATCGPLNQYEHWREVGGSPQSKMTDEPTDVSEDANNTSDVPEQVPDKKRDAACNKRDASVLE